MHFKTLIYMENQSYLDTFQIGIDHWISKRTSLYARAGYFKNNGTASVSWPGVSVPPPPLPDGPGSKQAMGAVGMTHRF